MPPYQASFSSRTSRAVKQRGRRRGGGGGGGWRGRSGCIGWRVGGRWFGHSTLGGLCRRRGWAGAGGRGRLVLGFWGGGVGGADLCCAVRRGARTSLLCCSIDVGGRCVL